MSSPDSVPDQGGATREVLDWATDFDPLDPRWTAQPDDICRQLRETCPVAHTNRHGGVFLPTRYADIRAVAYDTERFSSRQIFIMSRPMGRPYPAPPLTSDPPAHRLHRQLLVPAFTPRAAARYQPAMAMACRGLLAELARKPQPDAARDYAQPAAMRLTFMLFGVAPDEEARVAELAGLIALVGDVDPQVLAGAAEELDRYFAALIARRIITPGDDLVSLLASTRVKGKPLPPQHVCMTLRTVLSAAVESSAATIGFALLHLAQHPQDRARLVAEPELMETAVEEFLRLSSPVTLTRVAVKPAEIGGRPIPQGALVILPFGAANRDPEVFVDPERAILDRDDNRHIAFGAGIHRCIGMHAALMLIKTAVSAWLEVFPDFALDPARPVERFGWAMHGLSRVPVTTAPAAAIIPSEEGRSAPRAPRGPRPDLHDLAFNISGNQTRVFTRVWTPASAARGTIIYLHGYPDNGSDGDRFGAAAAAKGYQVICPDWPGRGRSTWLPPSAYTMPTFINLIPQIAKLATAEVSFIADCWSSFPVAHHLASSQSPAKVVFNDPPMRGGPGYDRIAKMLIGDGPKTFRDMADYASYLRESRGSTYLLAPDDLEGYARKRAIWVDGKLRGAYDPALTAGIAQEIGRASGIYTVLPFVRGETMILYAKDSDFWDDALAADIRREQPRIKLVTDLPGGHPSMLNGDYQIGLVLDFFGR